MILIPILRKDHDWDKHREKLQEEIKELDDAIRDLETYGEQQIVIEQAIEEAMDVIQVCIGIIYKVLETHREIAIEKIRGHIVKLINRGWKVAKVLKVEED